MPTRTIVEDYVLAAMARARHAWAENEALVLTVPDFPGLVACGSDVPSAMRELYRLLEGWIQICYRRGYLLPKMWTEQGEIDLNTVAARDALDFGAHSYISESERDSVFIGGPDEMEAFVDNYNR